jgi:hypothetical protein
MFMVFPGLVWKQVSENFCLCSPRTKHAAFLHLSCMLVTQVGKQGMEEYTYDLSRFEDFLTAKLAPV